MRRTVGAVVRLLPGGRRALRARRDVAEAVRRRVRPPRPPYGPPERVAKYGATTLDPSFITGNGVAARCRYVLNWDVLRVNEEVENDWWFCRADYLEYFFARHAPAERFVLFSHNSDRVIGRRFARELRRPELVAWFAQNPAVRHERLRALPIGIANPNWPHGDQAAIRRVQADPPRKEMLFHVSFDVGTNPAERVRCLAETGLELEPRRPFPEYLERLASAYFCLSPRGNGIDCVRTWEALYVGTIPVVTRSLVTEHHRDLPMIVLDDWAEFGSIDFTSELYSRTWGDWSSEAIRLDRYLERVEGRIASLR